MKPGLFVGVAAASIAIALALAVGPSPGPGVGTVAKARADADDTAPATEVIGRSVRGKPIVATRYGDATSDNVALVVGVIRASHRQCCPPHCVRCGEHATLGYRHG